MNTARWERTKEILDEALKLDFESRREYLNAACGEDEELHAELESLIASYEQAGTDFLSAAADLLTLTSGVDSSPQLRGGEMVGAYRLIEEIGRGGMGEVWLAEQQRPIRRRVAIKLIRAGFDSHEVVTRFESERQALALMDHPAIAKVFDAGSTPQGLPYFVMEYVIGVPITEYCDKHKLTMRQRLELFVRVCEGVQHAHQKAIIHRDLKPSNILVGEVDGKPMPRIIDFGVAKATSQQLTPDAMYTRVGSILGTPGYMSPEQADSAGLDVDTRTDVYSLGVVLYELLVAELPLDFAKLPLDEALRRLRNEDVPRPSTKLRTLRAKSDITAQNRGADVPTLSRLLKGDLDAIALKALDKARGRRYATPLEMAADIGRYLNNEPVMARQASAAYRAGKYVRRHRMGVSVAAAVMVLLVGFAVAQMVQLRRITRERDRADRLGSFMTGVFRVSDPSQARGNSVTARELLDKAAGDIDRSLASDPELQARMMYTMATTYSGLGLYERARSLLQRAVEIQRRVLGTRAPDTLRSQRLLAMALRLMDRSEEAEKLIRPTVEADRQVFGAEGSETLLARDALASALARQDRLAEAEKVQRETLDIQRRVLGPAHQDTLLSMNNLAGILQAEERYAEAGHVLREAIPLERQTLGPEHPDTLRTTLNLAKIMMWQHRPADAEKLHRELLAVQRRVLGPDHIDTLTTLLDLGEDVYDQHRYKEAEAIQQEALDQLVRTFGSMDRETIRAQSSLALTLGHESAYDQAVNLQREAARNTQKNDRRLLGGLAWDGACLETIAGHYDAAFAHLREAAAFSFGTSRELEGEEDLKPLHTDPRYAAFIAELRRREAEPAASAK